MKNAGFILKAGFVVFAAIAFNSNAYSQVSNQNPGVKQNKNQTEVPVIKSGNVSQTSTGTNQYQNVSHATLNPKYAAQKRGAVVTSNQGSAAARSCKTAKRSNPYSISRTDFNNLPKDRQQFILDNSKKYTIVD